MPGGTTTARLLIRAGDHIPLDTPRVPGREAARRELSKPMYHEHDPNLLQRGIDHFWKWIGDLVGAASGAAPGGSAGLVVISLAALAVIAALWWRLGVPRRVPARQESLFDDRPRTAAEHRLQAAAHASAGRWNQAVQERMRAIVRALEERALLEPRPGRTADEAAAEAARPLPGHADGLRAAARVFDDVTYGGRTADEPAYLRIGELDLALGRTKPQLAGAIPGTAE
ncbi:DUF4129 domain-containing protein [Streptomyces sp. NPDC051320]|uniref:DUF4129 domain-containing protein n=1 Tax=Streptomyces sp. NPDC051320 TaxID=3154644 RepID=UPI00344647AB